MLEKGGLLILYNWCSYKKRRERLRKERSHGDTDRGETVWPQKPDRRDEPTSQTPPRISSQHQRPRGGPGPDSSPSLWREHGPPSPWFWASGLQNSERINVCCVKATCVFCLIQCLSHIQLFGTPWTAARQASLSFTISWILLKLMCVESVMPSNHLTLCHPLLLPSIFPSIRVFSNESTLCIRWPRYWSFSFSISPSNVYSGLISFRIGWSDLLAVQRTLNIVMTTLRS